MRDAKKNRTVAVTVKATNATASDAALLVVSSPASEHPRCSSIIRAPRSAMPYTCGASDCGGYYSCRECIAVACEAVERCAAANPAPEARLPDLVQATLECKPRYVAKLVDELKGRLRLVDGHWCDAVTWCTRMLEKATDCVVVADFLRRHGVRAAPVVAAEIKSRIATGRAKLVEVQGTTAYTVRAATKLNAYDARSLKAAIINADCQGLNLRDVMKEYPGACRDLYSMADIVVEIGDRIYYSPAARAGPNPDVRELFGLPREVAALL